MSKNDKPNLNVSEDTLFRLVDGVMEMAEYQRTLVSLENSSDGWRRCAMAFLENQALEKELAVFDFDELSNQPSQEAEPVSEQAIWHDLMGADELSFAQESNEKILPAASAKENSENVIAQSRTLETQGPAQWVRWSKTVLGTAVALLVCFSVVHLLNTKNPTGLPPIGSGDGIQMVNYIDADVPVRDPSLNLEPDFLADLDDFDSIVDRKEFEISEYSSTIQNKELNGREYHFPVQKIQYTHRPIHHLR